MKDANQKLANKHDSRESWLKAATAMLRPHFSQCGYDIPEKMRFAIAFPSTGRKSRRVGELWHSVTSGDESYELIIRADIAEPVEVLSVLVRELVHSVVPVDAGHGKLYKEAALKIGLTGKMREAVPSPLLLPLLAEIADALGPLPHAKLDIENGPTAIARPKKQRARLLKATCTELNCGYTVRITSKWVKDLGPPLCPKHGPMALDAGSDDDSPGADETDNTPEAIEAV